MLLFIFVWSVQLQETKEQKAQKWLHFASKTLLFGGLAAFLVKVSSCPGSELQPGQIC